jgi:hypothetical protein
MAMAKRKRIGRPPKPVEERKSANLTLRVRAGTLEQLRAAAAVNGRSISEESEYRLVQSFRDQYTAEVAAAAAIRMLEEREIAKDALETTEGKSK